VRFVKSLVTRLLIFPTRLLAPVDSLPSCVVPSPDLVSVAFFFPFLLEMDAIDATLGLDRKSSPFGDS